MQILLVLAIVAGILIYAVALPYCVNNRKIIYRKNRKYFNAPVAYAFTSFIVTGICVFVSGIVFSEIPTVASGLGIFAIGIIIGIIPAVKASKDHHKGVIFGMIIASIGSITALWSKFLPLIADYSERKYKQYLEEEKQREQIRLAEEERNTNSYVYDKRNGAAYQLNSDGTYFKAPNGDWVSVNEALSTGDFSIKHR